MLMLTLSGEGLPSLARMDQENLLFPQVIPLKPTMNEWKAMNKLLLNEGQAPIDRFILSFASQYKSGDKGKQVSKVADNNSIGSIQCGNNEVLALNQAPKI